MKNWKPIIALALLSSQAYASTSLIDLYKQALEHESTYQISKQNVISSEYSKKITQSTLWPQISASAGRSQSSNSSSGEISPGVPAPERNSKSEGQNYGISLSQKLFDWGAFLSQDSADFNHQRVELEHAASLQTLMIKTAEDYIAYLRARDGLQISRHETEALKKQLEHTQAKLDVGIATITDFYDAKAKYDQAVAGELSAKAAMQKAEHNLVTLTGKVQDDLMFLDSEHPLQAPNPEIMDDWVRVSQENNLSIKAQQMAVRVARNDIKRSRSGHYPTLGMTYSYSDSQGSGSRNGVDLPESESDGTSARLSLSVPIFSGFRTDSEVGRSQAQFQIATQRLEQLDRQTAQNTKGFYLDVMSAIGTINAYKNAVFSNEKALETSEKGYQVGTRNIIDVLNNTRSLYQAKRSLSAARYNYIISSLKLKQSAGILAEKDLEMVNSWLLEQ